MGKLFRSNRSQAVRIPKEFEFPPDVTDVTIVRDGNRLVLEPKITTWEEFYERFPPGEFNIEEPEDSPPQERDFPWP